MNDKAVQSRLRSSGKKTAMLGIFLKLCNVSQTTVAMVAVHNLRCNSQADFASDARHLMETICVQTKLELMHGFAGAWKKNVPFRSFGGGGVGWDKNVHVHLHTMVMLRYEIVSSIWGGGIITFICTCARW